MLIYISGKIFHRLWIMFEEFVFQSSNVITSFSFLDNSGKKIDSSIMYFFYLLKRFFITLSICWLWLLYDSNVSLIKYWNLNWLKSFAFRQLFDMSKSMIGTSVTSSSISSSLMPSPYMFLKLVYIFLHIYLISYNNLRSSFLLSIRSFI